MLIGKGFFILMIKTVKILFCWATQESLAPFKFLYTNLATPLLQCPWSKTAVYQDQESSIHIIHVYKMEDNRFSSTICDVSKQNKSELK